jgi:predicted RNase H-like HicB family nuclease
MPGFLILIQKPNGGYSVYSPDLADCVATGVTREAAEQNMDEAIITYVQELLNESLPFAEPHSLC